MSDASAYFQSRLTPDPRRSLLWRTLWTAHFRPLVTPNATVLELGAGYCDFINAVQAARRIAVDIWPGMPRVADGGVETRVADLLDDAALPDGPVDFIFASNVLEHIPKPALHILLPRLRRLLSTDGQLALLQPNYRYCSAEYFDDYSHETVFSHVSLCDLLAVHGFEVVRCIPRFLPLTIKSRLPVHPLLIRAYLALPFRPFAKQMFVLARARADDSRNLSGQ